MREFGPGTRRSQHHSAFVRGGTGSFIVQMKTAIDDPSWTNVSTHPGGSVLVAIGAGNSFFRL